MLQRVPEPIAEDELYDATPCDVEPEPPPEPPGAPWETAKARQWLPATNASLGRPDPDQPQPPFPGPKPKDGARIAAVSVALDILSFRLILLLCVAASAGLFACTAIWPDQWRLAAAIAFSVIVTGPCMYFYRKAE